MSDEAVAKIRRKVGLNVKRLRDARGWSQGTLILRMEAKGIALHQTTVSKIENGKRPIFLDELIVMAEVFGVPGDTILSQNTKESE